MRSRRPSHRTRYRSTQVETSRRPVGSRLHGRHCASLPCTTSPACWSTLRCFDTPGSVIANGFASSPTVASPCASRARIARRVGSARAANVVLNGSAAGIRAGSSCAWLVFSQLV